MPFFALLILLPLLELWAFVEISGEIGFFTALALLILAGIAGSALIRRQGFQTVIKMSDSMDRGKIPLNEMFDAFCIVLAGGLLILPGFISDVFALLLLVPRLRTVLRSFIRRHPDWHYSETTVIEGEFERVDEDPRRLN